MPNSEGAVESHTIAYAPVCLSELTPVAGQPRWLLDAAEEESVLRAYRSHMPLRVT